MVSSLPLSQKFQIFSSSNSWKNNQTTLWIKLALNILVALLDLPWTLKAIASKSEKKKQETVYKNVGIYSL